MNKVAILKFRHIVIASMQSSLSDDSLENFQWELLDFVGEHKITAAIIDVTVLDVIDSFAARMLATLSDALMLRGARMVIVGIQPEVAFTMAQLGINFSKLRSAISLDNAMEAFLNDPAHKK